MKLNLKSKETRKKQVLVNTIEERVKSLSKLDGHTLGEAMTILRLTGLKTVITEGKEGAEIPQLCLITGTELLLIPYSRKFAEDESYDVEAELEKGEFHVANRRKEDDLDEGPFTGAPYLSFGYEATVNVLREEDLMEEEKEEPKKKATVTEEKEEN